MTYIINVENLVKVYDQKPVINHLDLSIKQGEIFGLLGPSGSGKTTTIKMLTGETRPYEGTLEVLDFKGKNLLTKEYRQDIGILSDNSTLYERLTVFDNLKMFARIYNAPLSAIDEVLNFVNLKDAKKKTVKALSKGMKQRVLLAKALLHKPKLVFLDEPTSALDPTTTDLIHKGLLKFNKEGTTIFLTTHDMTEAMKLCDRVGLLHNGNIIELGKPEDICYKYGKENIIIEDFLGQIHEIDKKEIETITHFFKNNQVKRIYNDEPNLEDVFIHLTGKELV